jgi:hypothetical protein
MAARKLQSIITAGALLALAGCSFMPAYERPAAPAWPRPLNSLGGESGTPAATWPGATSSRTNAHAPWSTSRCAKTATCAWPR